MKPSEPMWRRVARLVRPDPEADIDDEVAFHLSARIDEFVARGLSRAEAEAAARARFGDQAEARHHLRRIARRQSAKRRWREGLEAVTSDVRVAFRSLTRSPIYTSAAVLTLALGIGANALIFSVVDAALLRPLPFPDADRLVRVTALDHGKPVGGVSLLDLIDFARSARSFDGMVVYDRWRKNVSGLGASGEPQEMVVGLVPGSYFRLLGIAPLQGRLFTDDESVYGKHFVAAISRSLWRTRLASDPAVLGKAIRINGESYTIVAVMPDGVPAWMDAVTAPVTIWTPYAPTELAESNRGSRGNFTLGRLKPGVSYEQAKSEIAALAARQARDYPVDRDVSAVIEPLADTRASSSRPILFMLSAAVAIVLIIACANLASLQVARNVARARELATRAALGAGRPRLLQQLLVETALVSLAGGGIGLLVAWGAELGMRRGASGPAVPYVSTSDTLPQFWRSGLEPRVILFSLAIAIGSALLFGLAPALVGTRISLATALREGGRGGTDGTRRQGLRRLLVVIEVGLSLMLLFAAGLLVRTASRLERLDAGFPTDRLLVGHIYVPPAQYPNPSAITRFSDALGARLRAVPGVVDATIATGFPPLFRWKQMFTVAGGADAATTPTAQFAGVDWRYLATLGIRLTRGRDFSPADTAATAPVAIVNEAFVRRYLPGGDPVGRIILPGPPPGQSPAPFADFGGAKLPMTIVGVVGDFMNDGIAELPAPHILTLFREFPGLNYGFKDIAVRTSGEPTAVVPRITEALRALDPELPLGEIRSMDRHLTGQLTDLRLTTVLLAAFAGLGTVLVILGTYGLVAYLVAQQTKELGVRLALGAGTRDILWLVLRYGLGTGIGGIGVGLVGAGLVRHALVRFQYGLELSGLGLLSVATIALLLTVVAACGYPAWRACRIDPANVLRSD